MARKLPKKFLACGALYQNYRANKDDNVYAACRIVKKANRSKCKWSAKPGVIRSCKLRY